MKISLICLSGLAYATEKKVPPRHPLQRLKRLVEFSSEILNSGAFNNKSNKWINRWENKFANNGDRMKANFQRGNQRCGFYDENLLPHGGPESDRERRDIEFDRYNREDPCKGMKQIITGFSKWSARYISTCSGQKNFSHQANRMAKWSDILNTVLDCEAYQPETTIEPTTEQSTEPVTEPVTEPTTSVRPTTEPTTYTTTPSLNFPFDLNTISTINNYLSAIVSRPGLPIGAYAAEHGSTITISGYCYPDYVASIWRGMDCASAREQGMCDAAFHLSISSAEQIENGSWVTYLHCPECGCSRPGFPNFYALAKGGNRKQVDETDFLKQLDELLN